MNKTRVGFFQFLSSTLSLPVASEQHWSAAASVRLLPLLLPQPAVRLCQRREGRQASPGYLGKETGRGLAGSWQAGAHRSDRLFSGPFVFLPSPSSFYPFASFLFSRWHFSISSATFLRVARSGASQRRSPSWLFPRRLPPLSLSPPTSLQIFFFIPLFFSFFIRFSFASLSS